MILKSCNISSIMSNTFGLVREVGGDILYRAVVEQDFDFSNLLFCGIFNVGMIFAVGVAGLSFCCEGLVFVWFIRAVTPEFAEYFILDMVLVHSRVDWRVLLSMAFPSHAVVGAGWDFDNYNIALNFGLKTVSWVVTVSGVSGETGGKWYFGALILLI